MNGCAELVDDLHAQARDQVHLATIAEASLVAEMHIDLALFSEGQARVAEQLCDRPTLHDGGDRNHLNSERIDSSRRCSRVSGC